MISTLNSQAFYSSAMQLFQSPPDNRGGPSFEEIVSRHDADGDGKLSIYEVNISEEAFAKADANGDGVIDQTEFDDGGNKIIGDDLRSQEQSSIPPESGTGNLEDVESLTGLSVYQWIQSILQNSSSESDPASTIVNLLGSLNTIA